MEKTLESSCTARRSNQSILKEINPEYSLEGLMLKLKLQSFDHLMQSADSLEKTMKLGKIEGRMGRGRVWGNSRRWWRTRKPVVLLFMGSRRVRHTWQLNNNNPRVRVRVCSRRQTTYFFPNTGYHLKSLPSFTTCIPPQRDLPSSLHRILKEYSQAQCICWKLFLLLFNFNWLWNGPVVQSPTSAALLQSKLSPFNWFFLNICDVLS